MSAIKTFLRVLLVVKTIFSVSESYGQSVFQTWYDASLNYSWAKSIAQLGNGDFMIAGFTGIGAPNYNGFHLVKINSAGNYVWGKIYGTSQFETGESVAPTSDGGFIVAGFGDANLSGSDQDIYIIKTDASGNISWQKKISYSTGYEYVHSIIQASDGGYVTCGFASISSTTFSPAINVIKLSSTGAVNWYADFGNGNGGEAFKVIQANDGNFILTGNYFTPAEGSQVFLLKLNSSNGNILWSKTYGGSGSEAGYDVKQTADGGFIIAGRTMSYGAGDFDCFFLKTDNLGNAQWFKTYGNIYWDDAYAVVQTTDGGYAAAGTYSQSWGDRDFYLFRTDASGNLLWDKAYGGSDWEECNSMTLCADGGFALAGRTFTFISGFGYNAYVLKADASGNADCNQKPVTTVVNSYSLNAPGNMATTGGNLNIVNSNLSPSSFSHSGMICNATLPVELISFHGKNMDGENHLSWTTATEINNDYFLVQRGSTSENFKTIAITDGAGNSSQQLAYFYSDSQPFRGINYYRLQQTDYDGSFSFSPIIAINNNTVNTPVISPDPSGNFIYISQTTADFETEIITTLGKIILKENGKKQIDISQLARGIYFVSVKQEDKRFTQKFVKQ